VAKDNSDVIEKLHVAAMEKMEQKGLDPALVKWLKSKGKSKFPEKFRVTDANPVPKGWRGGYWNNLYNNIGITS